MSYGIKLKVSGDHALFTRPEMKVERVSYDVMTPSAARGILEAIHWKPAIRWVIDAIHVVEPIRFTSIRRNEVADKVSTRNVKTAINQENLEGLSLVIEDCRQQRASTVLTKVAYVIEAHFEMTDKAGAEDNPAKHLETFKRRARKGQCFHQPCLGTREFPARFDLLDDNDPMPVLKIDEKDKNRDLGFMLWDIDHADRRIPLFFRAKLENGILHVPTPTSKEICR